MKKNILIWFLILLMTKAYSLTYNGDLTLTTQAQVNAFNYDVVTGTLTINGNGITNIDALSSLDTAQSIQLFNTGITNINGLRNLKYLSGIDLGNGTYHSDILIQFNSKLNDLTGFGNIKFNGNIVLSFYDCDALKNLQGVQNLDLTADSKTISIVKCDSITSLSGLILPSVSLPFDKLVNSLTISENPMVVDVSAIKDFSVGGLTMDKNNSLENIDLSSAPAWRTYNEINITNNSKLKKIKFAQNTSQKITINFNPLLDSISGMNKVLAVLTSFSFVEIMLFNNKLNYVDIFDFSTGIIPDRIMGDLLISNNSGLKKLDFLKQIKFCEDLLVTDNPNLTNCCGIYNLLANNGVSMQISISGNPSACSNQSEIQSYCGSVINQVFGRVYKDINANNKPDVADIFVDNIKIQATKDGNTNTHISADTGKYYFVNDTGSYTIQPISNFANFSTVPVSQNISHSNYGNKDTVNFKLAAPAFVNDASIVITNNWLTRPNRNGTYTISYTNESGQNYNGTIKLKLDSRLNYQNAIPNPTSIVGDTIIWNISNLPLFTTKNITVNFVAPATIIANDTLQAFTKIYNAQIDISPNNNQYLLRDIVRASYDPNDKEVNKQILTLSEVAQSPYLYYTIRFQNVGNDTAFDISIKDTLDNNLDWTTFQPITSSHKYNLEQINNRYVLFDFKNIKLVDSTTNEKASHGFVAYKIKTKNTLLQGSSIYNKAYIKFDVNTPIITNNAITVIQIPTATINDISFINKIKVFPNPTDDFVSIQLDAKKSSTFYIKLISVDGRIISDKEYKNTANINDEIGLRSYSSGVYMLQILSENEQATYQIIKK